MVLRFDTVCAVLILILGALSGAAIAFGASRLFAEYHAGSLPEDLSRISVVIGVAVLVIMFAFVAVHNPVAGGGGY